MQTSINRRYFFLGSLALGSLATALSCSRRSAGRSNPPQVSIVRVPSYAHELSAVIRRILCDHRVAVAGKRILLKPNLVEFSMQPAGDLQPTTMDFWIPKINPVSVHILPQAASP